MENQLEKEQQTAIMKMRKIGMIQLIISFVLLVSIMIFVMIRIKTFAHPTVLEMIITILILFLTILVGLGGLKNLGEKLLYPNKKGNCY